MHNEVRRNCQYCEVQIQILSLDTIGLGRFDCGYCQHEWHKSEIGTLSRVSHIIVILYIWRRRRIDMSHP
jgi:hypothetical protein